MNDRELLELAAKASGIEFNDKRTSYPSPALYRGATGPVGEQGWWNPLADDGDALRLAVKLSLAVRQFQTGACVDSLYNPGHGTLLASEEFGTDPYAATRRAIVRAAAEIGKTMA